MSSNLQVARQAAGPGGDVTGGGGGFSGAGGGNLPPNIKSDKVGFVPQNSSSERVTFRKM